MKKGKLEDLFNDLQGSFDLEEPAAGHQHRFLTKLEDSKDMASTIKKRNSWWKPLSIAASIAILFSVGIGIYNLEPTKDEQVAEISPEVSQTQYYFASLIEEQVKLLESESTPETKKIIEDTMVQLKKLETNYTRLEQDLLNGGNSKLILSAMITNFQTRIDLLQDVLNQVDQIKTLKNYNDENITI
ncbi:hypothetical protein [Spongiimicrobium sp. 3-5]|uniref:hypothetical protein n=1 Tax=Spongiimicrobium sp. 3-5 TaxID=3332596 RepID=UPI00397EAD67